MLSDRLMQTFLDLVKIDSPSKSEKLISEYCKEWLTSRGFTVTFDTSFEQTESEVGNLIATLPAKNSSEALVLSAHMDCVPPCCGVVPVIEDRAEGMAIYSDGSTVLGADDKAGIAAIFEAIESILAEGAAHPALIVLLTTCEELGCSGAFHLDKELLAQRMEEVGANTLRDVPCVVFDSDGAPGTIVIGAPFRYTFEADFVGRSAHAGVEPEAGISAIGIAAKAIASLEWGRLDEHTTANVGNIHGGDQINIVSALCKVKGECRSLRADRVEEVKQAITDAFSLAANEAQGYVEMEWHLDCPGMFYSEKDALVQRLASAATELDLPLRYHCSGGASDANIFTIKGLKPVTVGIGMTNFHSLDEYILVSDLENSARYAEAIIKSFV